MRKSKLSKKKSSTLTVRLTDIDDQFIVDLSGQWGLSKSDTIRKIIQLYKIKYVRGLENFENSKKLFDYKL